MAARCLADREEIVSQECRKPRSGVRPGKSGVSGVGVPEVL